MSSDTLLSIVNLLLPEVLVTYFELTKHEINGEEIHFYFTELNLISDEFNGVKLHSKGYFPEATVQDFPIRGTLSARTCGTLWRNAECGMRSALVSEYGLRRAS